MIAAGNQAGTPNYDKAFKWFKSAAEHGLHDSQFNLAVLYERGLGTAIDKSEAYFWYSLAANQGDGDAGKRADGLAKTLTATEVSAAAARVASWSPSASADDANVVAITDPSWNGIEPASNEAPAVTKPVSESPVTQAQELLTRLGFNVGDPDGKMGSRTANAIRLFQLQSGLKVTGEVTADLLDAMRQKAG